MNTWHTLNMMLQETQTWKAAADQRKATMPLRSHLWLGLCEHLLTQATKISVDPQSQDYLECIKARILTKEGTWPDLQWDNKAKQYDLAPSPATPMQQMLKQLTALKDLAKEKDLILSFHSLKPSTDQTVRRIIHNTSHSHF